MAKRLVWLTTVDNPWNPFTDFSEWLQFDMTFGGNTSALLAREANIPSSFTDAEAAEERERAIDAIIANDIFGEYRKIVVDESDPSHELVTAGAT